VDKNGLLVLFLTANDSECRIFYPQMTQMDTDKKEAANVLKVGGASLLSRGWVELEAPPTLSEFVFIRVHSWLAWFLNPFHPCNPWLKNCSHAIFVSPCEATQSA
jgi:hypothetical protein